MSEDSIASGIRVVSVDADNFSAGIILASDRFHLDFDDAYQYTVAEKAGLSIARFDKDFDRTEKGRVEPKYLAA